MKRILIIRLSAIGDIVMASALIPALRRTWPDAHLAWLAEPAGADLLRHNTALDEVILWPRTEWQQLWHARRLSALVRRVLRFRRDLRRRNFDLVLDTQGLLKSGLLAWLTGARERIGLGSKEGSQHLMTRCLPRGAGDKRIGSEYLHLARALDLDVQDFPMDLVPGAAATATAHQLLSESRVGTRYAVVAPFTTRPQKHWFEERWVELIARMERELGLQVVMLGGPGDLEAAARIADRAPGVRNLVGHSRLDVTMALIRDSHLLIGVDTGLTHMGIAFDRPTVALFGSTRPYLDTGTSRAQVLYQALECSPCRRRPTCDGAFTCMRQHTVDTVLTAARRQLEAAG